MFTGYGYITPQTTTGRILCIFVALLGIPVTLLALSSMGELIAKWVNALVRKTEKKLLKRKEPKHVHAKSAAILFLFMICLMVVNSTLVSHLFGWTFMEGVYFTFISSSTIGFGDYIPKKSQRIKHLFINSTGNYEVQDEILHRMQGSRQVLVIKSILAFYYIFVLCIVSSVLNSIMTAIEEQKCHPLCPGCIPRKTIDHVTSEQNNTSEWRESDMSYSGIENFEFCKRENDTVGFQKAKITPISVPELE